MYVLLCEFVTSPVSYSRLPDVGEGDTGGEEDIKELFKKPIFSAPPVAPVPAAQPRMPMRPQMEEDDNRGIPNQGQRGGMEYSEPAGIQEQQSPFPRSYPSGPVRAININIDTDKIVKEYIQTLRQQSQPPDVQPMVPMPIPAVLGPPLQYQGMPIQSPSQYIPPSGGFYGIPGVGFPGIPGAGGIPGIAVPNPAAMASPMNQPSSIGVLQPSPQLPPTFRDAVTVTDPNGKPMEGAEITVSNPFSESPGILVKPIPVEPQTVQFSNVINPLLASPPVAIQPPRLISYSEIMENNPVMVTSVLPPKKHYMIRKVSESPVFSHRFRKFP